MGDNSELKTNEPPAETMQVTDEAELRLRQRDAAMTALIEQGGVTNTAQVLRADFGSACLNGLDITHYTSTPIIIRDMTAWSRFQRQSLRGQQIELRRIGGWASGQAIYINPKYRTELPAPLVATRYQSSVLGHETIHRLQYHFRKANLIPDINFVLPTIAGKLSPMQKFQRIGKDIRHFCTQKNFWANMPHALLEPLSIGGYFSRPSEMQARLHEIMAVGYAYWQAMPSNHTELYAALHNAGLQMPDDIKGLVKQNWEWDEALEKFECPPAMKPFIEKQTAQLNTVYNYSLTPEIQYNLWERIYPALYGSLIEMYGDRLGRERFGTFPSPQRAMPLAECIAHNNQPPDTVRTLCARLPAEFLKDMARLAAVYNRVDVLDHLLEREAEFPKRKYDDQWRGPLFHAIILGHEDCIRRTANLEIGSLDIQEAVLTYLTLWNRYGKTRPWKARPIDGTHAHRENFQRGLSILSHVATTETLDKHILLSRRITTAGEWLKKLGFPPSGAHSSPNIPPKP